MRAILVTATFTTRVIVGDNADEQDAIAMAQIGFEQKVRQDLTAHVTEIVADTECPFEEGEEK